MKYDKIRGKSVAECMMKLRSAYGSQAIILSTREVQEGGLLGSGLFSRKLYEIDFMLPEEGATASASRPLLAANSGRDRSALGRALLDAAAARQTRDSADASEAPRLDSPGSADAGSPGVRSSRAGASQSESIPPLPAALRTDASSAPSGNPAAMLAARTPEEIKLEREALDMLLAESPAVSPSADAAPGGSGAAVTELGSSARPGRSIVGSELRASRPGFPDTPSLSQAEGAGPLPETKSYAGEEDMPEYAGSAGAAAGTGEERFGRILHRIRGRLLSSQVSNDFADRFLERVDHSLSRVERAEYRNVEERSLEKLAEVIRTVPDIAPRHGECQAVMLMGPTGSGKTTSLAKLAARYHIMQGREVSIYSLDHYRLAATEQLKTYAGVMDVPFFAPLTPRDFSEYLRRDGAELMLIDTSGIGYKDADRIEQLQEYVDACEVRLEKHLVLAANTNAGMLEKILLAYDQIGLDKIILTKLDESDFLGAFIELADKYNRPFSFLMNGQDVPGSILEAESLELARMVLSGPGGKGDGMDSGT